jgi:hypothetical protein
MTDDICATTPAVESLAPSAEPAQKAHPIPPALRMRRHRERRRNGLRCLTLEVRATEIEALVRKGLLEPEARNDSRAIKKAIYAFLDGTLGRDASLYIGTKP